MKARQRILQGVLGEVVAAGRAHIARFSWERSAAILLDAATSLAR